MTKPTLTIAIPAYNEAVNLRRLLPGLLSQTRRFYTLEQITVFSDGSTDATAVVVRAFHHPLVKVSVSRKRLGKAGRENYIFSTLTSSIVVVIDADTIPSHRHVIDNLVEPLVNKKQTYHLTSGHATPFPPVNFLQRVFYAGVAINNLAIKHTPRSDMYRCEGQLRAFSWALYSQLRFPRRSAEDIYPFLFARTHGFSFRACPAARIYYKLPVTVSDYIRQQRRYLQSASIHTLNFGSDVVNKYFVVTSVSRLQALLIYLAHDPLGTLLYLVLTLHIHLQFRLYRPKIQGLWPIAVSTK